MLGILLVFALGLENEFLDNVVTASNHTGAERIAEQPCFAGSQPKIAIPNLQRFASVIGIFLGSHYLRGFSLVR
jgi:hypothetical protein